MIPAVDGRPVRLAITVSHPIQHFCPWYSTLAQLEWLDLHVFFGSTRGAESYFDPDFGRNIQWEGVALDFPHTCLVKYPVPKSHRVVPPGLRLALRGFGPDAVLVYGYRQALQRRVLDWARQEEVFSIMVSDSELRRRRAFWVRGIKRLLLPRLFRDVDAFLTVGNANEAYLRHYGVLGRRMFRSPFPIDVGGFETAFLRRRELSIDFRQRHGLPVGSVVLLTVGKLVAWKRQEDIIAAVGPVLERFDAYLFIAGSGPCEESIRDAVMAGGAGNRIRLLGFVPPSELVEYYSVADIYIHAAEDEPHSIAISEAVYSSCACVVSDCCGSYGCSDDVQPGRNGLVFATGDIEELRAAVSILLDCRQLLSRFKEASRRIGLERQELAQGGGLQACLTALGSRRATKPNVISYGAE